MLAVMIDSLCVSTVWWTCCFILTVGGAWSYGCTSAVLCNHMKHIDLTLDMCCFRWSWLNKRFLSNIWPSTTQCMLFGHGFYVRCLATCISDQLSNAFILHFHSHVATNLYYKYRSVLCHVSCRSDLCTIQPIIDGGWLSHSFSSV